MMMNNWIYSDHVDPDVDPDVEPIINALVMASHNKDASVAIV